MRPVRHDPTSGVAAGCSRRVIWIALAGRCLQGGVLGVLHAVLISTSGASGATYQGRQCSPVRFGSLGGRGLRPRGARYNISTAMNGSCQSLKAADKVVEGCEPCRTGFALSHIGTGTGLTLATSAPGLGSPLSHLRRDWARPPAHVCTGTGLAPAHICAGTGRYHGCLQPNP